MRDGQRHGHAAGPPDAALDGDVLEAGLDEECHSRLVEVDAAVEQRAGDASRRAIEIAVAVRAAVRDDRNARIIHTCLSSNRARRPPLSP